jgi:hypothetical protein
MSNENQHDLSGVIRLTDEKAGIITESGYKITGFVLSKSDGQKCVVDMGAVRWFDNEIEFFRMMHP